MHRYIGHGITYQANSSMALIQMYLLFVLVYWSSFSGGVR